ncbi:hypothetical protein [Rubrobacter indicoceani]|uniref:hypothetical protein n=1 Tax=Rubrobacter indicoceani TaxID=2051957 RepID=UPI000E5C52D0|nr:hypothetical protein [Rubrobacter indicoceani]
MGTRRSSGNEDADKLSREDGGNSTRSDNRTGGADNSERARGPLTNRYEERSDDRSGSRRSGSEERGTSWASVILGWLTALGAGLILTGIVSGIVGGILAAVGVGAGTAALIGLLVTLFLAFLIGGYAAGRMASRSGVKHGLLVPLLSFLIIILLAIVGAILGASFLDQLSGIALPQVPQGAGQQAQQALPQQGLDTILTVSGILALLVPFLGGALGGAWGAARGKNRP